MTCTRTERRGRGGDCGQDMSLTSNRLPASRLVHPARLMRGGVVAWWQVDLARLIRPYTHSTSVMICSPTHTLGTRNRNAGAQGNAKKCCTGTQQRGTQRKNRGAPARGNAKVHRNACPSLQFYTFLHSHKYFLCTLFTTYGAK